ncbi:MAG: twin-arginine translocation signal domain-containing protein, partial [Pirellulales bacterium]
MAMHSTRRQFLGTASIGGAAMGLSELGFLKRLPRVSAADATVNSNLVRVDSGIEPLVRLLEETSRERLLEEVAAKIQSGTSYREVLAALLLAGVRNVQPRPSVGFKFHSVLVVNAAHLASLSSPDSDRWLPIFWAIDYFKATQLEEQRASGWKMSAVNEADVPPASKARSAFIKAMD